MKILIVDDDRRILNALKAGLTSYGYEVVTAGDGHEALRILDQDTDPYNPIQIILTDIIMPGINGFMLVQSARAMIPDIHAVIMTAYSDSEVHKKAKSLGCGYLEKPFRPEAVIDLIKNIRTGKEAKGWRTKAVNIGEKPPTNEAGGI